MTPLSFRQLEQKYARRDRWGNVLAPLGLLVLAAAYFYAARLGAEWAQRPVRGSAFLFAPVPFEIGIWAFLLALCTYMSLVLVILRLWLGRHEYSVYVAYGGQKMPGRFHAGKVFGLFFFVFGLPLATLFALKVDTYTAFADAGVVENRFRSLGARTVRPYSEVAALYEVRGYHMRWEDKIEPYHLIVFNDGTEWESERLPRDLARRRDAMRYVAGQAVRAVRVVSFIEDVPGRAG